MKKPAVSIIRCPDYRANLLETAIKRAVEALPEAETLFSPGKTVLLKPNLLSANQPPEKAVNTHPQVIRGVSLFCKKKGCRVLIGDSCGSLSKGSTRKALEITGVLKIAEETGAEVVNFDTEPFKKVTIPNGKVLNSINISRSVLNADVVITIPKLKTHGLTLFTGAIKNQFGAVPGIYKKKVHLAAPKPERLSEALVEIFSAARADMAIMDAVTCMEGNGPAGGRPRNVGFILASADSVAMDAVAGKMIGYAPRQIMTTAFAARHGLGINKIEDINICGTPINKAAVNHFSRPSAGLRKCFWKIIPSFLTKNIIENIGRKYPSVLQENCVLCRECVINCPANAMEIKAGQIKIKEERCISCYCCAEACPHKAIKFS